MPVDLDKARSLPWVWALPSGGPGSAKTFRQMSYGLDEGGEWPRWLWDAPNMGAKWARRGVGLVLRCPGGGWPGRPADFAQLSRTYWSDEWRALFRAAIDNPAYPMVCVYVGTVRGMTDPAAWFWALVDLLELLEGLQNRVLVGLDEVSAVEVDSPTHPMIAIARVLRGAGFSVICEQGIMRHQAKWFPDVAGFLTTRSQLVKRDRGETNDFLPFEGSGKLCFVVDDVPGGGLAWASEMRSRGLLACREATTTAAVEVLGVA